MTTLYNFFHVLFIIFRKTLNLFLNCKYLYNNYIYNFYEYNYKYEIKVKIYFI